MTNVFIMGLGEIGLNTAKYYRDVGCTVFGWDIDWAARSVAQQLGFQVTTNLEDFDFEDIDVISICVATKAVEKVVTNLVEMFGLLDLCPLLIIESTVIPGTCSYIWDEILDRKMGIAHAPQRYWAADPHGRGVRRKRVLAASDNETFVRAIKFFKDVNMLIYPVYGLEVAEMCKVAENAYRYVMIAYAEELANVCKDRGIDFLAVKEAIETHQSIGYLLEPREGIGGHCLPMASDIMVDISGYNDIICGAKEADARYRKGLRDE
jgi:UDP-N-acetyl-D-mannosaminuronate dehydrogenase